MSEDQTPRPERKQPPSGLASWLAAGKTIAIAFVAAVGVRRLIALACVLLLLASPWPILSIVALLAYIMVAWNDPGWTVALLPLTIPFAYLPKAFPSPRGAGHLLFPVVELLALLAFATAALHILRAWRREATTGTGAAATLDLWDAAKQIVGDRLGLVAVTLAAIATFSLFTVADPFHLRESVREYRTVIIEPLLYFFLARTWLRDRTLRTAAIATFISGGVIVSLIAIGQVVTGQGIVAVEGVRRALGTYQHPNALGLYLGRVSTFALTLLILAQAPRRARWLMLTLPLLFLALLLTFSRGAFAGLGVAAAALTITALYQRTRDDDLEPSRLRIVLVAGCAIAATAVLLAAILSTTGAINLRGGDSLDLRKLIWTAALAMIRDHPAFGVGLDQFYSQYAPRYVNPAAWGERFTSHPHNLFLDFWVRLGIMGLAWLIWAISSLGATISSSWRYLHGDDRRLFIAVAIATLAAITHGLADNFFFLIDLAFIWWFFLGLVASINVEPGAVSQPPPTTQQPVRQRKSKRGRKQRTTAEAEGLQE